MNCHPDLLRLVVKTFRKLLISNNKDYIYFTPPILTAENYEKSNPEHDQCSGRIQYQGLSHE
jgi:hypothetical protein